MTFSSSVSATKWTLKGAVMVLAVVLVPALLMASPDDDQGQKAKVLTGTEKPAECISSVQVTSIDGKQVYVQPLGFDIEPGKHSLTGRAIINTSFCKAVGPSTVRDKPEPLEAEFEAGKTYYVGYDHSSNDRKDWKLVIWQVEG